MGDPKVLDNFEQGPCKCNAIMQTIHLHEPEQSATLLPYPIQYFLNPMTSNCKIRILIPSLPSICSEANQPSLIALNNEYILTTISIKLRGRTYGHLSPQSSHVGLKKVHDMLPHCLPTGNIDAVHGASCNVDHFVKCQMFKHLNWLKKIQFKQSTM